MNWKLFNKSPGDNCFSPGMPQLFGLDDALLVGAGVGLAGGLVNAFSSRSSQKSANAANLQAVRETNQANLDLYREQFADQYKLWQESNAYNDPSAQMSRLRNAGLNPSLMMQNGGANTAQAMSVPSANAMQAAHVEPTPFNFSDVATNMSQMAVGLNQLNQAQGENISNQYLGRIKQMEIAKGMAETRLALQNVRKGSAEESLLKARLTMQNLQNKMFQETYEPQKQSYELNNQLLNANIEVAKQQRLNIMADTIYKNSLAHLTDVNAQLRPAEVQNLIATGLSQIALNASYGEVNAQQAAKIFQEAVWQGLANKDTALKYEVYKASLPWVISSWQQNYDLLQNQNIQYKVNRAGQYMGMMAAPFQKAGDAIKSGAMMYFGGKALGVGKINKPFRNEYGDLKGFNYSW